MSFSEIGIIFIVAMLVMKPEDIPQLLKKVKEFYKFIWFHKKQIEQEINKITDLEKNDDEVDKINFYLKKIMDLDEKYDGDYSLSDVKAIYHQLIIKKKIK